MSFENISFYEASRKTKKVLPNRDKHSFPELSEKPDREVELISVEERRKSQKQPITKSHYSFAQAVKRKRTTETENPGYNRQLHQEILGPSPARITPMQYKPSKLTSEYEREINKIRKAIQVIITNTEVDKHDMVQIVTDIYSNNKPSGSPSQQSISSPSHGQGDKNYTMEY